MDIDEYYQFVCDKLSKDEFVRKIEEYRETFGNLLEDETLALMILDEYGRIPRTRVKISDLLDGQTVTLDAEVIEIVDEKVIEREGKILRRMDVVIADESGRCYVGLWNSHIEKIGKKLKKGDRIRIIDGYVKEFPSGVWIVLRKWSAIIIL